MICIKRYETRFEGSGVCFIVMPNTADYLEARLKLGEDAHAVLEVTALVNDHMPDREHTFMAVLEGGSSPIEGIVDKYLGLIERTWGGLGPKHRYHLFAVRGV